VGVAQVAFVVGTAVSFGGITAFLSRGEINFMPIVEIHADQYRVPLETLLSDSTHGEMSDFGLIVVHLVDESGRVGLGYTYTPNAIGASAIWKIIESDLAPLLQHVDPDGIDAIWEKMWWHLHFVGRGGMASFAMAAVDIALWDLRGHRESLALWRLLGGRDPKVPAYAGGIDLYLPTESLLSQAKDFLGQGFRAIKMKIGRQQILEDVERVQAMRNLLGPNFPLMADANMGWSIDQAIKAVDALSQFDLYWLEEPLIPEDLEGHKRLGHESRIPIATGENLHSVHEFEHLINYGHVDFPEPDAATLGGITPWMRVAELAQSKGLPVTSHGIHDVHVHLLAGISNASYLEVHGFGLERFIERRIELKDGEAIAPDTPGHGVKLDLVKLKGYREATYSSTN
jgi:L-alanine-DL-glutamate epimerase-like enolase superfamily enzyme